MRTWHWAKYAFKAAIISGLSSLLLRASTSTLGRGDEEVEGLERAQAQRHHQRRLHAFIAGVEIEVAQRGYPQIRFRVGRDGSEKIIKGTGVSALLQAEPSGTQPAHIGTPPGLGEPATKRPRSGPFVVALVIATGVHRRTLSVFDEGFLALLLDRGAEHDDEGSKAAASRLADSGRVTKTDQSPRDSSKLRRRFSSIMGPRMKPSSKGAGSQPNLMNRYPMKPKAPTSHTSKVLLLVEYTPIAQNSTMAGNNQR